MQEHTLEEGCIVATHTQTAGRGQIGNCWEAEPGKNLTFSVLLYPQVIPANMQFLISQITALSVKELLDQYTTNITVKWPNDVYWNERKICGMLIENDLMGREIYCSIIGIGLNINQTLFQSDALNPISLSQITGESYDLEALLLQFRSIFFYRYLELLKGEFKAIRTTYREALYRGKGFHQYQDEASVFEAEIADIESTGHLLLRLRNGQLMRYAFKEVKCV
jgi:BirA family biotin operon repressor/biotin-[acetyl-CoA-carboxylase] ligase